MADACIRHCSFEVAELDLGDRHHDAGIALQQQAHDVAQRLDGVAAERAGVTAGAEAEERVSGGSNPGSVCTSMSRTPTLSAPSQLS